MGCRDLEKCEKLRKEFIQKAFNPQIKCSHLDLESLDSVRKFAKDIIKSNYDFCCNTCILANTYDIFGNNISEINTVFNLWTDEKRLDVLVNNAGMLGKQEREVTKDGFEKTFEVNYLGKKSL